MASKRGKQTKPHIKKGPPSVEFPLEDQEFPALCVKLEFTSKWRYSPLRQVVEALGWEVWLESPGDYKGSTWWVRFPMTQAELSAEAKPNTDIMLPKSADTARMSAALHIAARSKAEEWKRRLAAKVEIVEVPGRPGRFLRSPQGFVQNVLRVAVTPPDSRMPLYKGLVTVGVEWRSPSQVGFDTREEAQAAALTEAIPGALYLLYI